MSLRIAIEHIRAATEVLLFLAPIVIRLKRIFAHCEKFLTVGESAWHWPLRKAS